MNIEFTTREYVKEHGKQPRGRGSWAFCPMQNYNAPNYLDFVYWSTGNKTLSEAKREAKTYFANKTGNACGTDVIVVCS